MQEGSVGAGTGTQAFGWKGGIGTSSRKLEARYGGYTVGVLVQSNYGGVLTMGGAPVGKILGRYSYRPTGQQANGPTGKDDRGDGSCMIVVATDAPLDARDLKRLAARAVFGLARTGSSFSNGSGEFAIAFSTAPDLRTRFGSTAPQAAHAAADRRRVAAVPGRARGHRGSRLQLAAEGDAGHQPVRQSRSFADRSRQGDSRALSRSHKRPLTVRLDGRPLDKLRLDMKGVVILSFRGLLGVLSLIGLGLSNDAG